MLKHLVNPYLDISVASGMRHHTLENSEVQCSCILRDLIVKRKNEQCTKRLMPIIRILEQQQWKKKRKEIIESLITCHMTEN